MGPPVPPEKGRDVVEPGRGKLVPALKRSLVELLLVGKFVDLGELPPAKDFGKTQSALSSDVEGRIVLLQAADYVHLNKHIPDLTTWMQCNAIYSAVLLAKHPERAQTLLMYSAVIARLSKKFSWPSWIIYDQCFQEVIYRHGQGQQHPCSMLHRNVTQCGGLVLHLHLHGPCQSNMPLSVRRRSAGAEEAKHKAQTTASQKSSPTVQIRGCLLQVEQVPLHGLPPWGVLRLHSCVLHLPLSRPRSTEVPTGEGSSQVSTNWARQGTCRCLSRVSRRTPLIVLFRDYYIT